jgi:hypothetical protein
MVPSLPLRLEWSSAYPAPSVVWRWPKKLSAMGEAPVGPLDFSVHMSELTKDIATYVPELAHLDVSKIAFGITRARNRSTHGLQARVTPMRFEKGSLTTLRRGHPYQVQQFTINGTEILYIVEFVLPRFQNRDYFDKMVTVIHELYHISPNFDGDIRRMGGRYIAHSGSQKNYDAYVTELTKKYLQARMHHPCQEFLRLNFTDLCERHGSLMGLMLPRPKLVRIATTRKA